jgi:hypothetical protein
MGRCYEFGTSIADGCDHAMAVVDEGGACRCPACGASCLGRFAACAQVLARPGYVPVHAPRMAVPPVPTTPPAPPAGPEPVPAPSVPAPAATAVASVRPAHMAPDPDPELADVRSMLEALLHRPDRAVQAIEAVNHAIEVRDGELLHAFERLTKAYEALTEEVRADHAARVELKAAVERLADRLETSEARRGILGRSPLELRRHQE